MVDYDTRREMNTQTVETMLGEPKRLPEPNRKCTDLCFCPFFCCYLLVILGIGIYAGIMGRPALLMTTYDADGHACGYSIDTVDYPYLYFPKILIEKGAAIESEYDGSASREIDLKAVMKYATCVKECPLKVSEEVYCYPTKIMKENADEFDGCVYQLGIGAAPLPGGAGALPGTYTIPFKFDTFLFMNRICVPSLETIG